MPERGRIPLANHPLYRGRDVDDARAVLSHLFTPVSVEPLQAGAPYSASVYGLELPNSAICYCQYPNGMIAGPEAPLDFHTIQLTLAGSARFDSQFGSDTGDVRTGIVLSAGQQMKVHHSPDNAILSFIVKDEVLRDLVSTWTGQANSPPLRFRAKFDPGDPRSASVLSLLDNFLREIDRPGGVLESPAALASMEQTLFTYMLFGLENSLSDRLRVSSPEAGAEQVKMVETYIEAHAHEPIDVGTIVRVTGHSASSLYRAFRRYRQCSPMAYLREVRIRRARSRFLRARPEDSVANIALACGFTHLGRFAARYRSRFGENPSATLDRVLRRG
jgi:AraC-like DNA-binding protein